MIQVIPKAVANVGYGGVLSELGTISTQIIGVADGLGSLTTGTPSTLAVPVGHPVSVAGTFRNLVVYSRDTTRPGDITVHLMVNGVATDLFATLPAGSTSVELTGVDVAVVAGDRVYYRFVGPATMAFGHDAAVCIEFEGTHSIYGLMAVAGSVASGNGKTGGAFGNGVQQDYSGSGSSNTYSLCALEGTLTRLDLYAHSGAPGAATWTGYIVVDGVVQDGTGATVDTTCILTGASVAAFSTFTLPTELGKKYDVLIVRSGGDAAFSESHVAAGVAHLPDIDSAYMVCGGSNDTTSQSALAWKWTRSEQVAGPETRHLAPVGPRGFTAFGLFIKRGSSPGGLGTDQGYVHTLRRSQADTVLVVTIADDQTEDVLLADVPFPPNGTISLQAEPFGSPDPAASQLHWGLALRELTIDDVDEAAIIGELVWVEFTRRVDEDALAEDPDDPPTPELPTPPSPEPEPPPEPPIPPDEPPPSIEGEYGPITEMAPTFDVELFPGDDIQAAIDANPAGTVYYARAGYYRHQTLTLKNGDELWGEFGAVMTGAKVLTGWFFDGARYYTTDPQTQEGAVNGLCRSGYPRCSRPEDVFYDETPLRAVASLLNLTTGTFYFDYGANRIYIKDTPVGHVVQTSVTASAFAGSATGVLVRNLVIEKYASAVQASAILGGSDWEFERCEIRHHHGIGIRLATNRTIHRCKIHHNGQLGFGGSGDDSVIEENEISYNNFANVNDYWEAGGSKITFSSGVICRSNWVHHNSGPGIWYDIENIGSVIEGNLVEDNFRTGIFYEISYSALIRFNTVRRNGTGKMFPFWVEGAGIGVTTSENVEVYGNTLEDNWQQIAVIHDHRDAYVLTGISVHDNVIINTHHIADGGGRSGVHDTSGSAAYSEVSFENNDYTYPPNGKKYFFGQGGEKTDAEWLALGHETGGSITRAA